MITSLWSILGFVHAGKLVPLMALNRNDITLRMRQENSQNILYPSEGGFGSFMDGLANGIDGDYATISTGLDDITF